jgi:hypothetical protein
LYRRTLVIYEYPFISGRVCIEVLMGKDLTIKRSS